MRAIARHRAASVLGVGPRAYRRIGAPAAAGREAAEERRGRVWCAANPSLQPSRCRPPIPPPAFRRCDRRRADGVRGAEGRARNFGARPFYRDAVARPARWWRGYAGR
jgi:hypothetical protein